MEIMGQYVPISAMDTVSADTGAVWENCTRGLPVQNPTTVRVLKVFKIPL